MYIFASPNTHSQGLSSGEYLGRTIIVTPAGRTQQSVQVVAYGVGVVDAGIEVVQHQPVARSESARSADKASSYKPIVQMNSACYRKDVYTEMRLQDLRMVHQL